MAKRSSLVFVWLIQALCVFLLFYFIIGPIFQLTFQNGDRYLGPLALCVLTFLILAPFWLLQVISMRLEKGMALSKTVLLWLGSYAFGLSPAVIFSWQKTRQMKTGKIGKIAAFSALAIGLIVVFYFLLQIYLVFVGDLFTRLYL